MASDTASSVDEQAAQLVATSAGGGGGGGAATDKRGRHRILAELNRLEQELKFLQVSSFCHLACFSLICCLFPRKFFTCETFPTSLFVSHFLRL